MEKITHLNMGTVFKALGTVVGGVISFMFGDIDAMLGFLAAVMIADYLTGMLAAGSRAELSSRIGYNSIKRKLAILIIVALAHGLDIVLGSGGNLWRDLAAGFYVGNELLSVFENVGSMDVLVPTELKNVINKFVENDKKKGPDISEDLEDQ